MPRSLSGDTLRIAFTGDFLRFVPSSAGYDNFQRNNVAWLAAMFDLNRLKGVETSVLMPPDGRAEFEDALGCPSALAEYHADPALAWASRYSASDLDVFERLLTDLVGFDVVVGFELPPAVKRLLHRAGRPYLSLHIHALRFLRDICFGASTNTPIIATALERCRIDGSEISLQIRRYKARFARQRVAALQFPEGLPVLIGQTEADSVLIDGGRFVEWSSRDDQIEEILKGHSAVVYLEHPYRQSSATIAEHLRSVHGKTVIMTNANGYAMLFGPSEIPFAATLASSLGVEAQAIGIPATFLFRSPEQAFLVPGIDLEVQGVFGHSVLADSFWREAFGMKAVDRDQSAGDSFFLGADYLRNTFDSWAFGPLRRGPEPFHVRKTVVPGFDLTERQASDFRGIMVGEAGPLTSARAHARAVEVGVQLQEMDHPLGIGEERDVRFNDISAALYLAKGFHAPEPWGVWSSGLRAVIVVPVHPQAIEAGATLVVSMRVYILECLLPRTPVLRIEAGGRLAGFLFFRPLGNVRQFLRFQITPTSTHCPIVLEMSELIPPFGAPNAEPRSLGIGLEMLTLSCNTDLGTDAATGTRVSDFQVWGLLSGDAVSDQAFRGT